MSILIDVKQVSKKYAEKLALNNVSFSLETGTPVALVGQNGAGKTTLFSLLCGFIKPSAGLIRILGQQPGHAKLFGRLSALPQDAQLDPKYSVVEQLNFYARLQGMSKKIAKIDTARVLDMVGLNDINNVKPTELSHGMRKRASIAQALLGRPEIVLLDEATAGLDPANARAIRAIVAEHANEINFILSSHDLSELERLCERVLYFDNGELKQQQLIGHDETFRFITLRMKQESHELIALLKQLPGIFKVENTQSKEYLIKVSNDDLTPFSEIELLQFLRENNMTYAQLINGKTLENQLF